MTKQKEFSSKTSDFTNPRGYLLKGLINQEQRLYLRNMQRTCWMLRALRLFRSGCSNYRFFNTRLRKLIKLQIDECMAETGEFI